MSHPEILKNPLPAIKNHTLLDDEIDMEDELKIPTGIRKCIFLQTSINDQRPKLSMPMVIEEMLNTGADVTMIIPEFWDVN